MTPLDQALAIITQPTTLQRHLSSPRITCLLWLGHIEDAVIAAKECLSTIKNGGKTA